MRNGLLSAMVICLLLSCSSSKDSNSAAADERKKIASFILVKSLPVDVTTKDSLLGKSLKKFVIDTLMAMGYKFISQDERAIIHKKFWSDMFGVNRKKSKEEIEKLKYDKEYYTKERQKAAPLEQIVYLFPVDSSENIIGVSRNNFPAMEKKREWLIRFEDSELVTTIAARIVDSITLRQSH